MAHDASPTRSGPSGSAPARRGVFTSGSTMRHVATMTVTAGIGLMAIFVADFIDLFFLALLEDEAVTAAIGFAGPVQFFSTSVGIGLSIATAALVAPPLGRGDAPRARRMATNVAVAALAAASLFALLVLWLAPAVLTLLGASGRAHALATSYLRISVISLPVLVLAMCSTSVLRSVGDAKRAMHVTLGGAIANVVSDPVAIFWLGLGIDGAALSAAVSRLAMLAIGFYGAGVVHNLLRRPARAELSDDARRIAKIAVPAILTNIATPFGNGYIIAKLAPFGDGAVAGFAIMARVSPVAFGLVFAITGAIGPILGQNLGIGDYARVRRSFTDALIFNGLVVLAAWLVLAVTHRHISAFFHASSDAATVVAAICLYLSPFTAMLGALLVANAAFNNLGRPHYATVINWGRATLGTMPFAALGATLGGAIGVITGTMIGTALFAVLAVAIGYRLIDRLAGEAARGRATAEPDI